MRNSNNLLAKANNKENSGENFGVLAHRKIVMGRRVAQLAKSMAALLPVEVKTVLDVGAGSGELAQAISNLRPELQISGVDVYIRPKTFIPVVAYDGNQLPYEDASFDAITIVDVLHHCDDPISVLRECVRVSKQYVLIKDHVADSPYDFSVLRFMDWIGNRAHGVVLPYNYLSTAKWNQAFLETGLIKDKQIDQLGLYPKPFDFIFGGSLHCLYLLKKKQCN